ncbi:MAG: conjugal transfer protein TraG N-terminal domain-containing protein [Alphaproteobacteria bacterium]|jgi:conjugal transfer mating pair stabilization protein TraG
MAWEVYTLGGGAYLWDVFNAVAAITKGEKYLTIVALTATLGLTWALLKSAFGGSFTVNLAWAMSFMLFYNVILLPTGTVIVHDPINRSEPYQKIDNVPFALAVFASMSSQVGYNITTMMEAAFSQPDDLAYHKNGLLFGSKLVSMASSMKIQNEDLAASMSSFVKQCVFYDILLHRYTLNELKNAPDIWAFLTEEHTPAKARSFEIREGATRKICTCEDGANLLKAKMTTETTSVAGVFGQFLIPDKTSAAGKNLIIASLPTSYNALLGVSQSASNIIRQNMMINAIDRAGAEFSNTGGYGANIYTTVRSAVQTKAAFSASKRQAEEWVPMLRIVFEVLFYGAFPLIFLMFLLPIGPQVAQGYFTTFVWLQSWAPLYAILNLIMNGVANAKMAALSSQGLTIATHAGIAAIQEDVALIAGYLSWSIPFIAAGLTKGAVAISGLSASMLAVPQSAANSAAAEAATGNISLGNTNLDNANYNNTSANKMNDSAFFDSARIQAVNHTGGMTSVNADGKTVYDQSGSVSRFPNVQLSTNDSLAESSTQTANAFQTMGENLSKQASFAKSRSMDQMAQHMATHSINENNGMRFTEHASADQRAAYNRIEQEANELSRNKNIDKSTALGLVMNGNASYGLGGGAEGKGPSGSLGGSFSASNDAKSSLAYGDSEKSTNLNSIQRDVSTVMNAVKDGSLELTDSKGHSLNESINQGFSEAERLEDQSRAYFDTAKSYTDQAQLMRSNSVSFSQDKMPEFIEYAKQSRDINGMPLGERALAMIANDPVATERLKENFIRSTKGNIANSFSGHASNLTGQALRSDYQAKADSMNDNVNGMDGSYTRASFDNATSGKHIDNGHLQSDVQSKINSRTNLINDVKLDKAGLKGEVQEKLSHDATTTMLNSGAEFLHLKKAQPKVSNFNNHKEGE